MKIVFLVNNFLNAFFVFLFIIILFSFFFYLKNNIVLCLLFKTKKKELKNLSAWKNFMFICAFFSFHLSVTNASFVVWIITCMNVCVAHTFLLSIILLKCWKNVFCLFHSILKTNTCQSRKPTLNKQELKWNIF